MVWAGEVMRQPILWLVGIVQEYDEDGSVFQKLCRLGQLRFELESESGP